MLTSEQPASASGGTALPQTRQMLLTVSLCMLLACFEGIDLQSAGLAVPQIRSEFALTAVQLGYFTAASSVGVLLGASYGGRMADRYGRRISLTVAVAIFGLASICTAAASSYLVLVVSRLFTGVGLGAAFPSLVALANENSVGGRKSFAVATVYAGFPVGGALASWIMSIIAVPHSGINGLLEIAGLAGDWRAIFYLGGLAPLIAVPLIATILPDSREFSSVQASADPRTANWHDAVFGGGRASLSVLLWLSFFATLMVLYLLLNWLPVLLNNRGFSRSDAFLVQTVFNLGGAVGSPIAGALMDSAFRRTVIPVFYAGLALLLILTAAMPGVIIFALIVGTLLGAFVCGTQALLYGLAPMCYPTAVRGTGVGIAISVGRFGSVIGPLAGAMLVGAGSSTAQVLLAIVPLVVVGGITAAMLTKKQSPPQASAIPTI